VVSLLIAWTWLNECGGVIIDKRWLNECGGVIIDKRKGID